MCKVRFSQSFGSHSNGKKNLPFATRTDHLCANSGSIPDYSQEFGTLNAFHQEIIVPKDLLKKINIS